HELREAVLADLRPPPGVLQTIEEGDGAAAEPAAELEDRQRGRRTPLLHRAGADEVVHDVEAIRVREEVDPQPEPRRREENLLAVALAAQERRIVLRDGLGQHVRRPPGRILALLLLAHRGRIQLRDRRRKPEARGIAGPLDDATSAQAPQHPVDRRARAPGLEPRAADEGVHGTGGGRHRRREPALAEDAGDETVDELVAETRGANERRGERRPEPGRQNRSQAPGHSISGRDVDDSAERHDGAWFLRAYGPNGLQMSKKLNHCVGFWLTRRSSMATHARSASSSP